MTLAAFLLGCGGESQKSTSMPHWTVERSADNPLLTIDSEGMTEEHGYGNVNGPSVIRVPPWIQNPLGRYYMYFAHHRGSFIRLAYADNLDGPWTVHNQGVLYLDDTPVLDHIASPDVHINTASQSILMYYHSVDDTAASHFKRITRHLGRHTCACSKWVTPGGRLQRSGVDLAACFLERPIQWDHFGWGQGFWMGCGMPPCLRWAKPSMLSFLVLVIHPNDC